VFVIMHLFTNFQLVTGDFQHEVNFIHSMPGLLVMEVTIWLSIAFHAGLGIYYATTGKHNLESYPNRDNLRYALQRATGYISLAFIFLHIATLRWHWDFGGMFTTFYVSTKDGYPLATATTARALQNNWVLLIYVIGAASVIFHWANGLWTAAITWGLTVTTAAQKRWGYVCTVMGMALLFFMAGAIVSARSYTITIEDQTNMETADTEGGGHHGRLE